MCLELSWLSCRFLAPRSWTLCPQEASETGPQLPLLHGAQLVQGHGTLCPPEHRKSRSFLRSCLPPLLHQPSTHVLPFKFYRPEPGASSLGPAVGEGIKLSDASCCPYFQVNRGGGDVHKARWAGWLQIASRSRSWLAFLLPQRAILSTPTTGRDCSYICYVIRSVALVKSFLQSQPSSKCSGPHLVYQQRVQEQ